jgi:hypothetical protein
VASHRHRDHIAGFDNERWHDVGVGEVWLPWVEDPDDPDAVALRNRQQAAALTLQRHFAPDGAALSAPDGAALSAPDGAALSAPDGAALSAPDGAALSAPDGAALSEANADLAGFVLNSLSNDDAMWVLQNGFAGRPTRRYISGQGAKAHPLAGVRGGCVYFLGPPRDPADLAVMDPPKAQRWLRAAPAVPDGGPAPQVFPGFAVTPDDYAVHYKHLTVDDRLLAAFHDEPGNALAAASLLDRAVNNTSVVFLLQVGEARLLFPGDAQWGAWRPMLDDPDVRSLLARTTVYKISHHGSHNGTPVEVAHDVFAGITSLLSVRPIERWAHIPKPELVADLTRDPRRVVCTATLSMMESMVDGTDGVTCHPDGLWKEITIAT